LTEHYHPSFYNGFVPDESDKIYEVNGSKIEIRSITDWSVENTINIGEHYLQHIDFYNDQVLTWFYGNYYIWNLNTGQVIHQIETDLSSDLQRVFLFDNTLYVGEHKHYINF